MKNIKLRIVYLILGAALLLFAESAHVLRYQLGKSVRNVWQEKRNRQKLQGQK